MSVPAALRHLPRVFGKVARPSHGLKAGLWAVKGLTVIWVVID